MKSPGFCVAVFLAVVVMSTARPRGESRKSSVLDREISVWRTSREGGVRLGRKTSESQPRPSFGSLSSQYSQSGSQISFPSQSDSQTSLPSQSKSQSSISSQSESQSPLSKTESQSPLSSKAERKPSFSFQEQRITIEIPVYRMKPKPTASSNDDEGDDDENDENDDEDGFSTNLRRSRFLNFGQIPRGSSNVMFTRNNVENVAYNFIRSIFG